MAPALTPSQAALVRLSAAIAAGGPADVKSAASEAIEVGVETAALYEILLQSYLFVGFPRAIEAFFAAGPVLAGAGALPTAASIDPERWRRDGESLCHQVYGKNYEKLMATMRGLSPDLASWMILEGYGKTLSRPALGPAEREYAVVAILTATRMWRQLRSHAIGAVNVGGTRAGVREAILLAEPWSGTAVVQEALAMSGLA
ncbi:MAG: carboxymuconolactone decarboxylase family protein [Bacteroidota bacterium]